MGMRFDRYDFASGEGLPPHSHTEDHLMVVVTGKVRAASEGVVIECAPGDDPLLFRAGRTHSAEALTDGTVILNIFKE